MTELVVWCAASRGGLADYAHAQANALADAGVTVELLCAPAFLIGRKPRYRVQPVLSELQTQSRSRLLRRVQLAAGLLRNAARASAFIRRTKPAAVLTHFSEYLAPLWAWRFRRLARAGVRFGTVLHDPVRDYVVGPRWWHERSVAAAFSFIGIAFTHGDAEGAALFGARQLSVPHGPFDLPQPSETRERTRHRLGIPLDAKLLLSYGYLRDNKNLDLVLRALAALPHLWLVVAGAEQAGGNRPAAEYQALAQELGCGDRIRWVTRFLSEAEAADLFNASDLNLLTYSASFVSASGVLATAAHYRLPSLISSGLPATRALVERYGVGIWIAPDSLEAIVGGLRQWQDAPRRPDWDSYVRDTSWQKNAEIVAVALGLTRASAGANKEAGLGAWRR